MKRQGAEPHSNKEKIRVQLDFTRGALDALDQLKVLINANTRAETIRRALRIMWWFVTEVNSEDVITITNKDKEIVSKFRAGLLDSTEPHYESAELRNLRVGE